MCIGRGEGGAERRREAESSVARALGAVGKKDGEENDAPRRGGGGEGGEKRRGRCGKGRRKGRGREETRWEW